MPPDTGEMLEHPSDLEATREVGLLERSPSFIMAPTKREDLEGGTMMMRRARLRSKDDPMMRTGPPEAVAPPRSLAPRRHLPPPAPPLEDEGEPTRVHSFSTPLPSHPGPGAPARRAVTGPPAPMKLAIRRPTPRPRHVAAETPRPLPPHRQRPRRPAPRRQTLDSISRICWNVIADSTSEPTRPKWFNIGLRRHRHPLAFSAGALGALITVLLVQVSWGDGASGSIEVISTPPGAQIKINGQALLQTTPAVIEVADVGRPQQVELELPHHRGWSQAVTLSRASPRITLVAAMEPEVEGDHGPVVVESLESDADTR